MQKNKRMSNKISENNLHVISGVIIYVRVFPIVTKSWQLGSGVIYTFGQLGDKVSLLLRFNYDTEY